MIRTTKRATSTARGRLLSLRGLVMIAGLTATWCALWQQISVANVISGIVVSCLVLATGIGTPARGGLRLGALLRLAWIVLVDLVTSTIDVAREIMTPTDTTNEAIVAVEIPPEGRHHFLLLIISITLTPGTAVVDADPDTGTLYLHLLHLERREAVTEHVRILTDAACKALPVSPSNPAVEAAS